MTAKTPLSHRKKSVYSLLTLSARDSTRRGRTHHGMSRGCGKHARRRVEPCQRKAVTQASVIAAFPAINVHVFSINDTGKTASCRREKRYADTPTKRRHPDPTRTIGVVRSASTRKFHSSPEGSVPIFLGLADAALKIDGHGDKWEVRTGRNKRVEALLANGKPNQLKGTLHSLNNKTGRRVDDHRENTIADLRQASDLCRRYAKLTTFDQQSATDMMQKRARDSIGNSKGRRSVVLGLLSAGSPLRPDSYPPLIKSSFRCGSQSVVGIVTRGCVKHVRFALPTPAAKKITARRHVPVAVLAKLSSRKR